MRPVRLTLEGIHSYREPVTIDFDELGRFGLFGIFGHIGSGKSTVLDGLTLALYGTVDRITSRSRRGLVNLACERGQVRLVFQATSDDGPSEYEVQRSYRVRDGAAERIASRLTKLGPPAVVIADKERDVNAAIAEIVGLGSEDFMRAVVLPQGRFQQLLHLKGSERRQMLQRIFRLHAYGESLRGEVQRRHSEAKHTLGEAKGELAGIGDASTAALAEAEARAESARGARVDAEESWAALSEQLRAARELRAAQQRLTDARNALAAHLEGQVDQQARERRVEAARRVAEVLGPAMRWQAARESHGKAAASLAACEVRLQESTERHREATQAAGAVAQGAEVERPRFIRSIETLRSAIEAMARRVATERELAEARHTQAAAEGELKALSDQLAAHAEARADSVKLRRALRRRIRQHQVGPEERSQVQRASRAAHALELAQRATQEARTAVDARHEALNLARRTLGDAEAHAQAQAVALAPLVEQHEALKADPDRLADAARAELLGAIKVAERQQLLHGARRQAMEQAERLVVSLGATVAEARAALATAEAEAQAASEVLRGAEAARKAAEARFRSEQRRTIVAELASALRPGSPCDVCGSEHHPAPAEPDPPTQTPEAAAQAHQEGHRRATLRHEAALGAHGRAVAALDAALEAERRAVEARASAQAELATTPAQELAQLQDKLTRHEAAQRALAGAESALREGQRTLDRAQQPVAVARAQVAQLEASAAEATERLAGLQAAEGEAWTDFDAARGDLTLFDVAHAQTRLDARDREAAELERESEAVEATLAELDAAIDDIRERQAHLQRELSAASERTTALRTTLQALPTVHDQPDPTVALAEAERSLAELDAALAVSTASAEQAARDQQAAARDHAAAQAAHASAADVLALVQGELQAAAQRLGPAPEGDLAAQVAHWSSVALPEAELGALQAEIDEWRAHRTVLEARLATLTESAGPRAPLSDDGFSELGARAEAARGAVEAARADSGAADGRLADLRSKAPRYDELQRTVTETDSELGRLGVLSSVLRGDRFVEYVASDYLTELAERASAHLQVLTQGRYGLEVDQDVSFQVRDAHGGGALRPVHTLSGGESFLTALSLALALSTQVQARSSRPLGFFFLDEGFGTLDPEALDRVMSAIEQLRSEERVIGLISHVPAVRERVPRYLWVQRAVAGGGSTVAMHDN